MGEPVAQQLGGAGEEHVAHGVQSALDARAGDLGERGAGDDDPVALRRPDRGVHPIEPRLAHRLGERLTPVHACLGGIGVQRVGVEEADAEPLREQHADGRLAGARHTHQHDGGGAHRTLEPESSERGTPRG